MADLATLEVTPPADGNVDPMLDRARTAAQLDIDAVLVADGPGGRPRMSSIAAAHLIRQRCGIRAIATLACRDRNASALRADLLGAHALGIDSVLAVTGDPARDARHVGELDSIGLLALAASLGPDAPRMGAVFAPRATDPARERDRLEHKVAAGATFVITQPVFDRATLDDALALARALDVELHVGIMPLLDPHVAARAARTPGIDPPPRFTVEQAQQLVAHARNAGAGVHLMPFDRLSECRSILDRAG